MPDLEQGPRQVVPRVSEEIDTFRASSVALLAALQAFEGQLTPAQVMAWQQVLGSINLLRHDGQLMGALLEEMAEYIKRLLDQRRSGRELFLAGWDARLEDIESRLSTTEYAQLRRALDQITAEDGLPF